MVRSLSLEDVSARRNVSTVIENAAIDFTKGFLCGIIVAPVLIGGLTMCGYRYWYAQP